MNKLSPFIAYRRKQVVPNSKFFNDEGMLLDDINSLVQVGFENVRKNVREWFTDDSYSRIKSGVDIVGMSVRVHEDDLLGMVLEIRPYVSGEPMAGISVGLTDLYFGSPKLGDMIARDPKNHKDTWLVAEQDFSNNFSIVCR